MELLVTSKSSFYVQVNFSLKGSQLKKSKMTYDEGRKTDQTWYKSITFCIFAQLPNGCT